MGPSRLPARTMFSAGGFDGPGARKRELRVPALQDELAHVQLKHAGADARDVAAGRRAHSRSPVGQRTTADFVVAGTVLKSFASPDPGVVSEEEPRFKAPAARKPRGT